eukprot:scaffold225_cov388-Prasinococcus_capsulatus_cf.AAC.28
MSRRKFVAMLTAAPDRLRNVRVDVLSRHMTRGSPCLVVSNGETKHVLIQQNANAVKQRIKRAENTERLAQSHGLERSGPPYNATPGAHMGEDIPSFGPSPSILEVVQTKDSLLKHIMDSSPSGMQFIEKIGIRMTFRQVKRGDRIVSENEETRGDQSEMWLVSNGSVAVISSGEPVSVLEAGAVFGEQGLLKGTPRMATIEATETSFILGLSRTALKDVLNLFDRVERKQLLDCIMKFVDEQKVGYYEHSASFLEDMRLMSSSPRGPTLSD